jgi:SAM-dependent methyltransferase
MNRNEKVLSSIDRSMRILEVGPLGNAIAPKSGGWLTTIVDHASREQLVEKYRNDSNVDTSRIEEVDIIWLDGSLEAAVPRELHGTFDAFIASHVFEHIPDPIGLMRSLERVLRPTGVISLVIPDKRFCFDFFRPLSTTGGLLDAHARHAVRHSRKSLFDHVAYAISADGEQAFSRVPVHEIEFWHSLEDAKNAFDTHTVAADAPYVDVHGWQFTPSSFALVVLELSALEAIDFMIDRSLPGDGCEFYVTLRRGRVDYGDKEVLQRRRLKLQRSALEELGEQANMLDGRKADLTAELAEVRASATALSNELDEVRATLTTELAETRASATAVSNELVAVRATLSWRVTRPLRSIRRRF